ncbi:MAG: HipA domain-containing protein, partial [Bacteroidetes bacterium]|nr:HipA domain-containing protein [Bacteroidota bacterium]
MKMNRRCLYCYKDLDSKIGGDYHAHCSVDFFGTKEAPALAYSLNQMADLAKKVVERSVAVPGVQPKLSLTLIKDTMAGDNKGRLTIVGALGGNFILKPPSDVYPEIPQNEHLTMRMAAAFKLNTVKSSLIRLQSGELAYITRRVDRKENGEKIHMLD